MYRVLKKCFFSFSIHAQPFQLNVVQRERRIVFEKSTVLRNSPLFTYSVGLLQPAGLKMSALYRCKTNQTQVSTGPDGILWQNILNVSGQHFLSFQKQGNYIK